MKHKYWPMCALATSLYWVAGAQAQPPDAGQPRAGLQLTPEQAQQFQLKEQAERQKKQEEAQAAQRRTATGMLYQFADALNESDLVLAAHSIEGEPDWGALRQIAAGLRRPYGARNFEILPLFDREPGGKDVSSSWRRFWTKPSPSPTR